MAMQVMLDCSLPRKTLYQAVEILRERWPTILPPFLTETANGS